MMSEAFWKSPGADVLDEIRVSLRDLMHLIEGQERTIAFTDFEDEFSVPEFEKSFTSDAVINRDRYLRKIRKIIEEHSHHLIIEKIRNAKPLTDKDLETLEQFLMTSDPDVSPEEFHEIIGKNLDLVRFVRSVSGLDRAAVITEFGEFLKDNRLSSTQIQFIEQMIEFYTQKGHLEIATLYEPPFDFLDQDGIDGVFRDRNNVVDLLIEKVERLNEVRVG